MIPLRTLWRSVRRTRALGLRPDDPSHRYTDADRLELATPSATGLVTLRDYVGPLRDQGAAGSCVANGILGAEQTTLHACYGVRDAEIGSRLALYYWARYAIGEHRSDDGCRPMDAVAQLAARGIAPESSWPYVVRNVNRVPPASSRFDGRQRRGIRGTYALYDRGDALIQRLRAVLESRRSLAVAFDVDEALDSTRGDHCERPGGRKRGGHMVEACGLKYEGGQWWLETYHSWGNVFDRGFLWLGQAWIESLHSVIVVDPQEPAR